MATEEIPPRLMYQFLDVFSRTDELLEANLRVLMEIRDLLRARAPLPEVAVPPRVGVRPGVRVAPPPVELRPLTDRLDRLAEGLEDYAKGLPVVKLDRRATTSTSYQKVVEWIVGEVWGPLFQYNRGKVSEISLSCGESAQYDHAQFRLVIDKPRLKPTTLFENKYLPSATSILFPSNELEASDRVRVEVRSDDGTEVEAYVCILGKEWG